VLQEFYMPTWSKAELEAIAPLMPNATKWRERFKNLGGIPWDILEVTARPPTQMLEAACTDCSLDDCIKKRGINATMTETSKAVHLLVHVTSTAPYTNSTEWENVLPRAKEILIVLRCVNVFSSRTLLNSWKRARFFQVLSVGTRKQKNQTWWNDTGHSIVDENSCGRRCTRPDPQSASRAENDERCSNRCHI
jgi:hypothetical protein